MLCYRGAVGVIPTLLQRQMIDALLGGGHSYNPMPDDKVLANPHTQHSCTALHLQLAPADHHHHHCRHCLPLFCGCVPQAKNQSA
jgi:hypothetical protein